ncbi:hypothetical protein DJ62_3190 [Yersinia enterocolitica]|nr:hypothetical protein DJ62_3190 [Yersinia enterocolitica]
MSVLNNACVGPKGEARGRVIPHDPPLYPVLQQLPLLISNGILLSFCDKPISLVF